LAERLRSLGEDVRYPELPDPFEPELGPWLEVLRSEVAAMDGERVVLCHSLACLLWMHYAREVDAPVAERVLLVAPPCDRGVPAIDRFWPPNDVDKGALVRACARTLVLWAEPDPYCPGGAMAAFVDAFPDSVRIPDGGHLNTDAGYGPWPEVERWALDGDFGSL
jgi:predicted alpha/beta hydrolase family esterase